jgi:hypothetical protein
LSRIADRWCEKSEEFFALPDKPVDFKQKDGVITFRSRGFTPHACNRTVYLAYRPQGDRGPMTLAVPAWNTQRWRFKPLLPTIRQLGFGGASVSLPYQDERMPEAWTYAHGLVSADIGLTLRGMQQAVLDTMDSISVLQQLGHERIVLTGISIGSGILNLVDAHDPRPFGVICVLCGDNFAQCVWNGMSTRHVRKTLDGNIEFDALDRLWKPISAESYVHRLAVRPRPLREMLTSRYDYTFPPENGRRLRALFDGQNVAHGWTEMGCGHYTLSRPPFSIRFLLWLKNHLRTAMSLPDPTD